MSKLKTIQTILLVILTIDFLYDIFILISGFYDYLFSSKENQVGLLIYFFISILIFAMNIGIFYCILKKKHLRGLLICLWIRFAIIAIIIIIAIIFFTSLISKGSLDKLTTKEIIDQCITSIIDLLSELVVIWLVSALKKENKRSLNTLPLSNLPDSKSVPITNERINSNNTRANMSPIQAESSCVLHHEIDLPPAYANINITQD